jgi:hypothetical protein
MIETIFSLGNLVILPFWVLMIFAPRWEWTRRIMGSAWVAAPPAVLYVAMFGALLMGVGGGLAFDFGAFGSAAGVAALLGDPFGATVGWMHFLAFDLFVGRWIYLDSQARGLSPWLVGPILFFTLMAGPVGFLAYLVVQRFSKKVP